MLLLYDVISWYMQNISGLFNPSLLRATSCSSVNYSNNNKLWPLQGMSKMSIYDVKISVDDIAVRVWKERCWPRLFSISGHNTVLSWLQHQNSPTDTCIHFTQFFFGAQCHYWLQVLLMCSYWIKSNVVLHTGIFCHMHIVPDILRQPYIIASSCFQTLKQHFAVGTFCNLAP